MADLPDSGDETDVERGRGSTTGTPRWVKVSGIITAVVILLFVILLIAGSSQHGPSRHTGGNGGRTPPAGNTPLV